MTKRSIRKLVLVKTWILLLALPLILRVSVQARQAAYLPFQGQLTDQAGTPFSPIAPVSLLFRLYENPVGGTVLWEEPQINIATIAGRFNVLLGSVAAFPEGIFNRTVYLGITIDDGDGSTTDVEMRPRQAIVPVIRAISAGNAQKLAGRDWTDILVGSSNDPRTALIRADKVDLQAVNNRIASLEARLEDQKKELMREYAPIGTIVPFAGANPPDGWFKCDGSTINLQNRPDTESLFRVIKNTFGGNGTTTFALPNLSGRVAIGAGQGNGLALRSVGQTGGAENHSLTLDEVPPHKHATAGAVHPSGFSHAGGLIGSINNAVVPSAAQGLGYPFEYEGSYTTTVPDRQSALPHSIMQPFLVVNYIIKYK